MQKLDIFLNNFIRTAFEFNSHSDDPIRNGAIVIKKMQYYSSALTKLQLWVDMDLFLNRQPKSYLLTPQQEQQLVQNRTILAKYYDTLRNYTQLPYLGHFNKYFFGSRSYADRVYNQQFKGSLFITRRLFTISLDSQQNPFQQRVLKYDQPLYKSLRTDSNPLLHEELKNEFDENLLDSPFLEVTETEPFYSGWDQNLRQLVVTNRFFPKKYAGGAMKVPNSKEQALYSPLYNKLKKKIKSIPKILENCGFDKAVEFSAWPLSKDLLEIPQNLSKIQYNALFITKPLYNIEDLPANPKLEEEVEFFTFFEEQEDEDDPSSEVPILVERKLWKHDFLPPNIRLPRDFKQETFIEDLLLPPYRGGFTWPGNKSLQIDLSKLFELNQNNLKKYLPKNPLRSFSRK